jgi:hypothetical protein
MRIRSTTSVIKMKRRAVLVLSGSNTPQAWMASTQTDLIVAAPELG